jgi:hypothetical protein
MLGRGGAGAFVRSLVYEAAWFNWWLPPWGQAVETRPLAICVGVGIRYAIKIELLLCSGFMPAHV